MNKLMQMMGVGVLTLGLGLSPAFAMTEDEARTAVGEHAKASKWEDKYRTEAINTLNKLIQDGVPVDKAYAVVNACIDKGIRGTDLAQVAKDIHARMDKGASAEAAVKEAMNRIEQRAARDGRDQAKDGKAKETAKREQARDAAQEHTRDHARDHGGSGYGAGAGAGGREMGGGAGGGFGTGGR